MCKVLYCRIDLRTFCSALSLSPGLGRHFQPKACEPEPITRIIDLFHVPRWQEITALGRSLPRER